VVKENKTENKPVKKLRDAAKTRERILEAAKTHFFKNSYENVGVREIAADADVDAALVNRYFGSKEKLFTEVVTSVFCKEHHTSKEHPISMDLDKLGENLARHVMTGCHERDSEKEFDSLQLLLRSAVSPTASPIIAKIFHDEKVLPLAEQLGGEDANMRAGLIISYFIGLLTMRVALKSPTINPADTEKIVKLLGSAIQTCVDNTGS